MIKTLKEDHWGAEVSELTVTIDESNFKKFEVGNKILVNCNGKDYIRIVRDFPEDIGIVIKGYPIFYSDFEFVSNRIDEVVVRTGTDLNLNYSPKKFKLGESHEICFERLTKDEWYYDPAAASKEFHIDNILNEFYKKTNTSQIEELLIQISEAIQNYDVSVITDITKSNFKIFKIKGIYIKEAKYNPLSKTFLLYVNEKCLQDIKDFKNIKNIKNILESFFVHEDTHRQQDIASNGKFFDPNKYIDPVDIKNRKAYVNQRIEIDAYARQYGFELRRLYPEETTDKIFKRIFNLDIEDDNLKANLEYLFENLTVENQKFFLRNIYDYINGDENFI